MFSINMLNGLFDPIINWFSALFYYLSVLVYYLVICSVGQIVDIIQFLFRKFAGLDDMSLNGQTGDIVMQFINSSIVQQVFFAMLALAVVLILITTFAAVIKTEFSKDGNNSKNKVIRNAIKGVANFVIVPIVCIFGLIVGNGLLKAIDGALTTTDGSISMVSQIFVASGYNSNRVRNHEDTGDNATGYEKGTMASWITGGEKNGIGYGNFGIFLDDTTGTVKKSAADKIDDAFANNLTIDLTKLTPEQKTLVYTGGASGEYGYVYIGSFPLGRFPVGGWDFTGTVNGNRTFEISGDSVTFSVYNIGLVSYFYDISLGAFNYIVAIIALLFAAWVYVITLLGLIKRLFMLVTLFIISAPVCALYPLDDGKALSNWRTEFIKQALAAYSVVIVMNIFFLLLPLMLQIEVITVVPNGWYSGMGISVQLINYIARILIVAAALMFFKDANKTIAGIIGAGDAYGDSVDKAEKAGRRIVGGAIVAGRLFGIGRRKPPKDDKAGDGGDGGGSPTDGADEIARFDAAGESGGKFTGPTSASNSKNSMNANSENKQLSMFDDQDAATANGVADASAGSNTEGKATNNSSVTNDANAMNAKGAKEKGKKKSNGILKSTVKGLIIGGVTGLVTANPIGVAIAGAATGIGLAKGAIKNHNNKKWEGIKQKADAGDEKAQKKLENRGKPGGFRKAAARGFGAVKDTLGFAASGLLAVARGDKIGDVQKSVKSLNDKSVERQKEKIKDLEEKQKNANKRLDAVEKQQNSKKNN